MRPRWVRLGRDAWAERGRLLAATLGLALALAAFGALLGARETLLRELARNYGGTRPADATLVLSAEIAADSLADVRALPGVAAAERGEILRASYGSGGTSTPALLFVHDEAATVATQRVEAGDPDAAGLTVERVAAETFGLALGDSVDLRLADGRHAVLPVVAVVHDPALAPAWQERTAWLYTSRATLSAALGAPVPLEDLRVRFDVPRDQGAVDAAAGALAESLAGRGLTVLDVRVPPVDRHPHQRQVATLLLLLVAFAGGIAALGAVLLSATLAATLRRQARELGVLKTLGATSTQLAGISLVLVLGLGFAADLVALPLARVGAVVLAARMAALLNLDLAQPAPSALVGALVAVAGLVAPALATLPPILGSARATVRDALDRQDVASVPVRSAALPAPLRTLLRHPRRLALQLALLGVSGATLVAAEGVRGGWDALVAQVAAVRRDDVEVRLSGEVPAGALDRLRALPALADVERWTTAPAAWVDGNHIAPTRAWPDGGHGSFSLVGVPDGQRTYVPDLTAGRWLLPDDTDAVVLTQGALAWRPDTAVGDTIELAVGGRVHAWRVVGLCREVGSAGAAYVADGAFPAELHRGDPCSGSPPSVDDGTCEPLGGDEPSRGAGWRAADLRVTYAAPGGEDALRAAVDDLAVEQVVPRSELVAAVGGHVALLVGTLRGLAFVLACIGGLGVGSATAIGVIERAREVGVRRTLGATGARIVALFVGEAAATGLVSGLVIVPAGVAATVGMDVLLGSVGFLAPLPFVCPWAVVGVAWAGAVVVASAAALVPALAAGERPVVEALAAV